MNVEPTSVTFSRRRPTMTVNPPAGHSPVALREFVIKVYERCNLACDYCYMYEFDDQTWKEHPTSMSREVFSQLATRIAEHAKTHDVREVDLVFHGGEPLLRGLEFFKFAVAHMHETLPSDVKTRFRIQTNGILLTENILDVFTSLDVRVGVSIDGDRVGHDLHRRYRNGKSSYDEVVAGVQLLSEKRYRPIFSRLYCTVDVDSNPLDCYTNLAAFDPPVIDFILPHGNWDAPPPKIDVTDDSTPYADWLITIFDHWFQSKTPQPAVRLFTEIVNLVLGGQSRVETIGVSPSALVIVETDGAIEQTDALRSAFHGATHTGFNIFDNTFDEVLDHPAITFRQIGLAALAPTCQSCVVGPICGAGYIPHRYSSSKGFDNPSIYCKDLMSLIQHMQRCLKTTIDFTATGVSP